MVFIFLFLFVGLAYGSDVSVTDGKAVFPSHEINGEFVFSESDRAERIAQLQKKSISVRERQVTPNSDEIFISSSVQKFNSRSDFESYFTRRKIFERVLYLVQIKNANLIMGLTNPDIDAQINYLKEMYSKYD